MEKVKAILSSWDVEGIEKVEKNKETVFKIVTKSNSYILKNKNIDKIYFEYEMLSHLKNEKVPVSLPILTKNKELYVKYEDEFYLLYDYIEGESLEYDYELDNNEIIFKYGEVLGSLHRGLKTFNTDEEIHKMNMIDDVFNWAVPLIEKNIKEDKYNDFAEIILEIKENMINSFEKLPFQFIHRDPHPLNIIFYNGKWKGFIDFDLCVKGYKIFDLCYILTSQLMGGFDKEINREKWIRLIPLIISGYEKNNELTSNEKEAIGYIFLGIELIFVAYFLKVDNKNLAYTNLEAFYYLYNSLEKIRKVIKDN